MTEDQRSISTFENTIQQWPDLFRDFNDGGDTVRWAKFTADQYAPAMLVGQESPASGVRVGAVIDSEEEVLFSAPCFFDDDPVSVSQAGQGKVRFNGKARDGVLAVTNRRVAISHDMKGRLLMVFSWPRERTVALNELSFKLSMMSMTSAGPGFELLYSEEDGSSDRVVFRLALEPRRDGRALTLLRSLVSNPSAA